MSEIEWNSPNKPLECFDRAADKIRKDGHLTPKKHSERLEFLSRQHTDFKTLGGMKAILQAVTWRVKIEEINPMKCNIYVRKKRIPDVRRLAKEFGIAGFKYDVKEIGWLECWFKRFQATEKGYITTKGNVTDFKLPRSY